MTSKISPEHIEKNNNWNVPISYFCIPIVCENNNIQISCCHYTDKIDNKGCKGCCYCFNDKYCTCCGIIGKCGNCFYSPLFCYEDESFQQNCCIPFCLSSSIMIKKKFEINNHGYMNDNLYLHSCLGCWCIQKYHINDFYDPFCICINGECNRSGSPCNYGCGVGPIGFTAGGNCFPLCWDLQCGNLEIFYKYLCCLGIIHKTPKYDKGCSSGLPICLKRTEILKDGKKYIEEKGVNYLLPWKVNIMI
jgi:hypothetical protein